MLFCLTEKLKCVVLFDREAKICCFVRQGS